MKLLRGMFIPRLNINVKPTPMVNAIGTFAIKK
jgi:hypothetical protein